MALGNIKKEEFDISEDHRAKMMALSGHSIKQEFIEAACHITIKEEPIDIDYNITTGVSQNMNIPVDDLSRVGQTNLAGSTGRPPTSDRRELKKLRNELYGLEETLQKDKRRVLNFENIISDLCDLNRFITFLESEAKSTLPFKSTLHPKQKETVVKAFKFFFGSVPTSYVRIYVPNHAGLSEIALLKSTCSNVEQEIKRCGQYLKILHIIFQSKELIYRCNSLVQLPLPPY